MTVVKRMTAKGDFLKMPLKARKCEVEMYEDCKTRKLLEECKCVPWELPNYQVGNENLFEIYQIWSYTVTYRICQDAIQREETALNRTSLANLTAKLIVRASMQMLNGWMNGWTKGQRGMRRVKR